MSPNVRDIYIQMLSARTTVDTAKLTDDIIEIVYIGTHLTTWKMIYAIDPTADPTAPISERIRCISATQLHCYSSSLPVR